MEQVILQISKSQFFQWIGGIGVAIIGISVLISSLILERFKQHWQKSASIELENIRRAANIEIEGVKRSATIEIENIKRVSNKDIEDLKGDIAKNNSIITTLLGQRGQAYQKVLEKKIVSTQTLWECITKIKVAMPSVVIHAYDILTENEFEKGSLKGANGSFARDIEKLSLKDVFSEFNVISSDLSRLRPFISQKLFLTVYVYHGFISRTIWLLKENFQEDNPKGWRKDVGIQYALKSVLSDEEFDYIYKKIKTHSYSTMLDLLETKIINEINSILSGENLVDDTIAQVIKLSEVLEATKTASK